MSSSKDKSPPVERIIRRRVVHDDRWPGGTVEETDITGDWHALEDSLARYAEGSMKSTVQGWIEIADRLRIAQMEREWLLGAWAALADIPQAEAEAEMLVASEKWRANALAEDAP